MTHRRRRAGWMTTGALTTATLVGLTGCSDGSGSDSASESDSASYSASASASAEGATPTAEASSATAGGSSEGGETPEATVEAWVAAVVKGDTKEACLLMGEAATGSSPAQTGSEETCGTDSAQGKRIQDTVGQFKESFTPDPPTADPKVEATAPADASAEKAVFPADRITIDGKTLEEIIISNSTGVGPDQLDVKIGTDKLDGAWYVTDMDFNIG